MKEVLELLNKIGTYYLATADGNLPHVRPIGFVMEHDGKLAFCTSNEKNMYKQMQANPSIEISGFDGSQILRITGVVEFITSEDTQRKALEVMPALSGMYAVGDGKFEIFRLASGKATSAVMATNEVKEWAL